jgi:hypothetical protein
MMAVDPPCWAKASARHMTKVVLPTPPLVEQTLMTDMAGSSPKTQLSKCPFAQLVIRPDGYRTLNPIGHAPKRAMDQQGKQASGQVPKRLFGQECKRA